MYNTLFILLVIDIDTSKEAINNIRIILVGTTHSGNIGSTARAMLNMGFKNLYLVSPKAAIDSQAYAMSGHAKDVIENIVVVNSIADAISDVDFVIGTSARIRKYDLPLLSIEQAANKAIDKVISNNKVGIMFGRESSGLLNDELLMCNCHCYIPTNDEYTSLNLSQAVQIVVYEVYKQFLNKAKIPDLPIKKNVSELAPSIQCQNLYDAFDKVMLLTGFTDTENICYIGERIRRIFQRSSLETKEANILRGFLASIEKNMIDSNEKK